MFSNTTKVHASGTDLMGLGWPNRVYSGNDRNSKRRKENAFYQTLHGYAEAATIHGLVYLFERGQPWLPRGFWFLVVIACLILTVGLSLEAFNQWQDNRVFMAVKSVSLPVEEIEFPAITICAEGVPENNVYFSLERQVTGLT